MMYALSDAGSRVEAVRGSEVRRARCEVCMSPVMARTGAFVRPHWAHFRGDDCDTFGEPETAWHREWKSLFPPEMREVVIGPHRADVRNRAGIVLEFQHSPISADQIDKRESFYEKMVWVFDVSRSRSRVSYQPTLSGIYRIDDVVSINWRKPPRSILTCRFPVFLDFRSDGRLFLLKQMPAGTPPDPHRGLGIWVDKLSFVNFYKFFGVDHVDS